MPDEIFEKKEQKDKDLIGTDELTSAELHDLRKPINLSQEIQSILSSDLGLIVINKESKAIKIVKVESRNIAKIVIYLNKPMPFIKEIIKFYQKNKISIVHTSGICFRGLKMQDCLYESYLDLKESGDLSSFEIIEAVENIPGVEKIFFIPIPSKLE